MEKDDLLNCPHCGRYNDCEENCPSRRTVVEDKVLTPEAPEESPKEELETGEAGEGSEVDEAGEDLI